LGNLTCERDYMIEENVTLCPVGHSHDMRFNYSLENTGFSLRKDDITAVPTSCDCTYAAFHTLV
jgi:hypothetical protein